MVIGSVFAVSCPCLCCFLPMSLLFLAHVFAVSCPSIGAPLVFTQTLSSRSGHARADSLELYTCSFPRSMGRWPSLIRWNRSFNRALSLLFVCLSFCSDHAAGGFPSACRAVETKHVHMSLNLNQRWSLTERGASLNLVTPKCPKNLKKFSKTWTAFLLRQWQRS